jgi:large subunit ribosomal protein L9
MEVILLERVPNLGRLGDRIKVKPGYGRNYLIPQGKALSATPSNLERFEAERARLEAAQAAEVNAAQARADAMAELVLTITVRAGDDGRLFGSVGAPDICEALAKAGHEVDKREVRLPAGPLRDLGEHPVQVHLHADVNAVITVAIVSDQPIAVQEVDDEPQPIGSADSDFR